MADENLKYTIVYKGLSQTPVLNAGDGRHLMRRPDVGTPAPQTDLFSPLGAWYTAQQQGMKLNIRQDEQERVLSEISDRIDTLAQSIDNLNAPDSLTDKTSIAVSGQPDAVAATATDEAQATQHLVQADWEARQAKITSGGFNPIERVQLEGGDYNFSLWLNGEEKELSFSVNPYDKPDTQEELLQRMSRTLNEVDGVEAEVVYGFEDAHDPAPRSRPMNRVARLEITAPGTTDAGDDIYLEDTSGENLLATYGLDTVSPRRNAQMKLDGVTTESADNDGFSLDDGNVRLEVEEATVGKTMVDVTKGAGQVTDELNRVLAEYNSLLDYLDSHADLLRPSLKDRLVRPAQDRYQNLRETGLVAKVQGMVLGSRGFDMMVKNAYDNVHETLLADEGWLPALRNKIGQIQDMDLAEFGLMASPKGMTDTRQAKAWLEALAPGIVNVYS